MKNVTYFSLGWFVARLIPLVTIGYFLIEFKNFSSPSIRPISIIFSIYVISALLRFFFRNRFGAFEKIILVEVNSLVSVALLSKNEILVLVGLLGIAEYFHFKKEFYTIAPSEKWDGNEVAEEKEE